MATKQVEFYATIYPRGQAVGFEADGSGKLILLTDASQIAELMKLTAFGREKLLRVNISWDIREISE